MVDSDSHSESDGFAGNHRPFVQTCAWKHERNHEHEDDKLCAVPGTYRMTYFPQFNRIFTHEPRSLVTSSTLTTYSFDMNFG